MLGYLYAIKISRWCDCHKLPHKAPLTRPLLPRDGRKVGMGLSRIVCIAFTPLRANIMEPFSESFWPQFYTWATFHFLWTTPLGPSNFDRHARLSRLEAVKFSTIMTLGRLSPMEVAKVANELAWVFLLQDVWSIEKTWKLDYNHFI